MKLSGKVAIVTGSARGIGEAIARKLASEGASVVVTDINIEGAERVAAEINNRGGEAIAVKTDVADRGQVRDLVKTTLEKFKAIHILVNNAAIGRQVHLLEMSEEDWDDVVAVNLTGVFHCTQAALKHMIDQEYGKIVNISSAQGTGTSGTDLFASYASAKGGVNQLTKAAARAGGPHGVNVNAIAPGMVLTDLIREACGTEEKLQEFIENRKSLTVLPHVAEPEDIANLTLFLASDDSRNITGQVICSDGGRTDRL